MIEHIVTQALLSNAALSGMVSKFIGRPSIWVNSAPNDCPNPYIVVSDNMTSIEDDRMFANFTVDVDCFDYDTSTVVINKIALQVECVLDGERLLGDNYDYIRINLSSSTLVPESDIKELHYNLRFDARATRKKWIQQQ